MNEQLIIRLPSSAKGSVNWLVWSDSEQEVIATGELASTAELGLLQEKAEQRRVITLLPASDVAQHRVSLPRSAQRSWQQVAPFMLEEQLAQDPDELHIVLLGKDKEAVELACISHKQMASWQDMLETAGINSRYWTIDSLCLPQAEAGCASAIQLNQQWLLRFADGKVMNIDQPWLATALALLEQDYPELVIQHYSPAPDIHLEHIQWQEASPELAMKLLSDGLKKSPLNLLQGRYAPSNPLAKIWQQWRKVAVAAGICFALALAQQVIETHKTEQQIAEVKDNIREVYKQVFPQVSRVRDSSIRRDFRRALAELDAAPQQDFVTMMVHLAGAFEQERDFAPLSLRYDHQKGEIRLQAQAKSYQSFEKFRQAVQPYVTEQGTLSNKEGAVVGTLVIRKAS
ncbi:type II secretion system protein GspL [Agarivorans gilvus]|uniref:Type II secretion system protein L n=1 Tax=Agarivorans gilvus TaxID=680279 RepID=A0ABQ1I3P7_9ALTE|nr:type II secretion system protein GspL [Agarivorans gilvus]GGB12109.1 type II secretion system protein L [Agarivorans gilvus]